ncbi:MAG: hypothetical protein E6Q89_08170 [Bacteroidia bacterium]|nr:MAG: hypothetical protein E6Q89_08170 [Bacteroidia bacterium]
MKVERIRTDIAVAETKRDKYLRQIMSFEDKINFEKKKNSTENLNKLTEMINSLKGVLPSVSSAIDKHYYNCYGAGNVKTQKVGDVTVYIVSAAKIADYLKSVYGSTIKVPNLNGDISFNRVDIFGSGWTGKYGYPFPQNAFGN